MTGTTDQASTFGALNAPKTAVRLSRAAVLAQLRGFAFRGRVWLVPLRTARGHRPMVERSIAWLTRGNRKLRYRGVAKNNAWLHLRVTAINLRRLLTLTPKIRVGQPIPN